MILSPPRKVLGGAAVTALCFATGMYLTMHAEGTGTSVPQALKVLGILAVTLPTFEWGAKRGFRIQDEEGRIHLGHIVRCLAMSAIMVGAAGIVGAALFSIAFTASR